ncbi:MAG TPA: ankyrin repeat domain-containing protein [Thermoanaerobaculia bacterium]|nr:ankyrin repeat domain-containing protein [Thermoanaerobaculia bacterium]
MSEFTDAIKAGDVARVTALLEENPALVRGTEHGVTPLLLAIYHGKRDVAQLLVDRGAPVSFGEACALGDEGRVRELLAADPALLRSRSADGFPGVGLAIFFGHGALARWLIEQGADVNAAAENVQRVAPVHAAAAVRDRETMQLLLERGADANAKQQNDYTPLHGAASRGDVEMAELLLAHGADRNALTADGMTAADVAQKYGHSAFAEWLEST